MEKTLSEMSTSKTTNKIISFEELENKINNKNRQNKKVVQCHGVFDLLHVGHIRHFRQAKTFGDVLVVTITADKYVNKGPGRPYFPEHLRAEAIAALNYVDYVVINYNPTAIEAIKTIQPDYYVKGIEYQNTDNDVTGKITEEEATVKAVGGQLRFTEDIVFSSSTLLNRFFPSYSPEVLSYLDSLKTKYHTNDILQFLDNQKKLKVLVIGEAIIDIYHYGEVIGKSGKEPVLVSKYHTEESYIGGVLAVANHLSSFCEEVTCLTMLGEKADYEPFIRDNLSNNVKPLFHYKANSPTIVKRRFLEEYSSQKLFEIYEINDEYLNEKQRLAFIDSINDVIADYDVVIVTDYGHGLLEDTCIKKIEEKANFLAINAQSNAGNHGFNCISKYKKADYVCIATRELQLNYRQKNISVLDQLNRLVKEFDYDRAIITNGMKGSYSYKKGDGVFQAPAFTSTVKDRVGAGDAVLAVTSLCAAQNAPADLLAFIGNVVGAEAVNIMGNESFIEKTLLMKHIIHLLK